MVMGDKWVLVVALVVAIAAAVLAVLDKEHSGRRWFWGVGSFVAVVAVVPTAYAVIDDDDGPDPPGVRITDPPEDAADAVDFCPTVRMSGNLSSDKAIAVGVHAENDPRIYFEGGVDRNSKAEVWTASVQLGDDPASSAGETFNILAIAMDADLAEYLTSTNSVDGATWWSSPRRKLPPGAEVLDRLAVLRSDSTTGTCG
jgi:hypothetical protein